MVKYRCKMKMEKKKYYREIVVGKESEKKIFVEPKLSCSKFRKGREREKVRVCV